jgi:hypothetical protein
MSDNKDLDEVIKDKISSCQYEMRKLVVFDPMMKTTNISTINSPLDTSQDNHDHHGQNMLK